MEHVVLRLSPEVRAALWNHLLPKLSREEEVAFVVARYDRTEGSHQFRCIDWFPVPASGFASRSAFHLELSDETRAGAIKRAHDLGACLVELHSHLGEWPAEFSGSDLDGFDEFVPHVWWRLKGRPYVAVVVAPMGFDGLAWITGPSEPQRLARIETGRQTLGATGLTPLGWKTYDQ